MQKLTEQLNKIINSGEEWCIDEIKESGKVLLKEMGACTEQYCKYLHNSVAYMTYFRLLNFHVKTLSENIGYFNYIYNKYSGIYNIDNAFNVLTSLIKDTYNDLRSVESKRTGRFNIVYYDDIVYFSDTFNHSTMNYMTLCYFRKNFNNENTKLLVDKSTNYNTVSTLSSSSNIFFNLKTNEIKNEFYLDKSKFNDIDYIFNERLLTPGDEWITRYTLNFFNNYNIEMFNIKILTLIPYIQELTLSTINIIEEFVVDFHQMVLNFMSSAFVIKNNISSNDICNAANTLLNTINQGKYIINNAEEYRGIQLCCRIISVLN